MPNPAQEGGGFDIFHNRPVAPATVFHLTNSTQSWCPGEALLSSGRLCRKSGALFLSERRRYLMKRRRISWALTAVMVSGVALVMAWPHAREAGAILAA